MSAPGTGALPQELIRKKRDGGALSAAEIGFLVDGIASGALTEGQVAAFAMAVFFRGMTADERVALATAMGNSGRRLDWRHAGLGRPVIDKHSTGGVGDKVSLVLAPLAAACGLAVPMISGRGLGHTGGTLDKLTAIPGYEAMPAPERFIATVRDVGCAIIGQTADLAPADQRLYAVRDVTATVESMPLITASILSKKLAAGLDGLVMDVKFGSGAFMTAPAEARGLAESLVETAQRAGLPITALLTDMNQVLGHTAGNAVEVHEAIDYLTGRAREKRLDAVIRALGVEMLLLGKVSTNADAAAAQLSAALASGAAAERFAAMVAALGGPRDLVQRPARTLPAAPHVAPVPPLRAGIVSAIDVRAVGLAVVTLGGGRTRADARIDPAVGLTEIAGLGDTVGPYHPLCLIHARAEADAVAASETLRAAFTVGDHVVPAAPVIAARI
ncbi:MAG: thymidine phosphorylase [Proteobacteria bacterium]|nr:thymidine phosphorylase [Pseudomonadota bacterium]